MAARYHQYSEQPDGSICVRLEPGDPWTLLEGAGDSDAATFANQQNKFWRPWHKESIQRHAGSHVDDAFSKEVKKP